MEQERRAQRNRAAAIRKGDHGAYTSLRWVSTLFKSAAIFLAVAVFAEFIAGVRAEGWGIMPLLLGEVARAALLGVLLWAGGDLVRLLIQIGRDLRGERVLLARIAYRISDSGHESVAEELEDADLHNAARDIGGAAGEGVGLGWGRGVVADPNAAEAAQDIGPAGIGTDEAAA